MDEHMDESMDEGLDESMRDSRGDGRSRYTTPHENGMPPATGHRRNPFGPSHEGINAWSPMPHLSTRSSDEVVVEEASQLARALMDRGPLTRRDLQLAVGSRYWGPQRFHQALQYALERRMIRQVGRHIFAPPEPAPGDKTEESEPERH